MFDKLWKPSDKLWVPATKIIEIVKNGIHDGIELLTFRRDRRGRPYRQSYLRLGPNTVHVFITHRDGGITDLGLSQNLLTNIGRDVWDGWIGGFIPAGGAGSPATAAGASSITATGTPWTASALGTPQLGLAGMRVYASVTGVGTAPVYGNIVSNTTSVATIDKWWTATDTTGTTPANTNAFIIGAGGIGSVRFMALSADAGAASAADTVLASEITTNSLGRALATYAHTYGATTLTLQKAFSPSGTQASIVKMGLFCALSSAGADPMIFEDTFSSASVISGDTLTVTDTITTSG
jgi:hypothetical protein